MKNAGKLLYWHQILGLFMKKTSFITSIVAMMDDGSHSCLCSGGEWIILFHKVSELLTKSFKSPLYKDL